MAQLSTVSDYVATARTLLQDLVAPYRYTDPEVLTALNLALLDTRAKRPDVFLAASFEVPSFSAVDTTAVDIDQQVRTSVLYYMLGHLLLRDDEEGQDARAVAFMNKFSSSLTGGT